MRFCLRVALFLSAASLAAPAPAQNYPVKDAIGATQTMASKLNGGVNFPEHVIVDPTGAHGLAVTAAGAAMVDGSAVTQPVSGAVSLAGSLPGFTAEPTVKLDQTAANNGVQVVNSVAVTGSFWQTTQPVSGTFWPATQPISAAGLPLPAGAATAAAQPVLNGDGGALSHVTDFPSSQAVTGTFWQTTQPISAASLPLPTGAMAASGGTVGLVAGSAVIGHVIVDAAPTTAVTIASLPSGAVTNAGAFAVQAQPTPVTSGGLSKCFLVAAASSNSTNCKASAGQVYHISAFNNSATVAYLHMINAASAPTCSSATTADEIMVPANGGVEREVTLGDAYSTGISFCLSGGIAANDNTAVAASAFTVTVFYK